MLLETEYGWSQDAIGIVIGLCFLCCIPVKSLYDRMQQKLLTTTWIRLSNMVAVMGSLLLFRCICEFLRLQHHCAFVLLLGDACLFPSLFLSDALTAGTMLKSEHTMPEGSRFDVKHMMLYRFIFMAGIGRNLGPSLARLVIAAGGQDNYASQQFICSMSFIFLFETFVRRRVERKVARTAGAC